MVAAQVEATILLLLFMVFHHKERYIFVSLQSTIIDIITE